MCLEGKRAIANKTNSRGWQHSVEAKMTFQLAEIVMCISKNQFTKFVWIWRGDAGFSQETFI